MTGIIRNKSQQVDFINYLYIVREKTVYILSIYNKSEQADISDKELKELLKSL